MGQDSSTKRTSETVNDGVTPGPSSKVSTSDIKPQKPLMRTREAAPPKILACTRVHDNNGAGKHAPLEKVIHLCICVLRARITF